MLTTSGISKDKQLAGTLQEKLIASASSQTSTGSEATEEEANARFYKYLQQIYATSKELDAEVASTPNTKKEIKKMIVDLAHGVKGLITWGRLTGRVRPVVNTRGNQTELPATREKSVQADFDAPNREVGEVAKTTVATDVAVPALEETRSAINELRVLMVKQGEALGELTKQVQQQHRQNLYDGGRRGAPTRNSQKNEDKPSEQYDAAENDNISLQLEADRTEGPRDDSGWKTVQKKYTKRPRSPRNEKREEVRTRNRSDVVIVQTKPENYSEVLKKIKSGVNMEAIGNKISALRQTRSGGILIQVSGGSPAADVVRAEVSKIVETDTVIRTPKQQSLVEFRGLDSLTNIDELVAEIVLNADTPREAVKVLNMRKTYGETQSALVFMPWDNAAKITKIGRIRVGLVYCNQSWALFE
ncbi:unnamed protein product [Macrosiphum euphorbiae]|uniref:Uncharacterized protein n=1 Tax=Macrosiphum euphorbiae TaxID=13131 RepID=A0AAV0Y5X8_9HEMI|nr:unnamed protein product [Macrosiphum euphorbiae]